MHDRKFLESLIHTGSGVVKNAENVQVLNGCSIMESSSLSVSEPGRARDNNVRNGTLDLTARELLNLPEVHASNLSEGEVALLPFEVYAGRYFPTRTLHKVGGKVTLLDLLDLGVGEGTSDQSLQAADGVLEVGDLQSLCGLSQKSLLIAKRHQ